jgi:hypothetical protein
MDKNHRGVSTYNVDGPTIKDYRTNSINSELTAI